MGREFARRRRLHPGSLSTAPLSCPAHAHLHAPRLPQPCHGGIKLLRARRRQRLAACSGTGGWGKGAGETCLHTYSATRCVKGSTHRCRCVHSVQRLSAGRMGTAGQGHSAGEG